MERQLREARNWTKAQARQEALREHTKFLYDGWEQDDPQNRKLIFEFLNNVQWFLHARVVDRNVEGMMLKKTNRRGFWKKQGVYEDRVGAAHYFIGEFEVN